MQTVLHIVGARPNFMKTAAVMRALATRPDIFRQVLVHTGQHYDERMSTVFFDELDVPRPDVDLEVGSGTHAWQTGQIMQRLEPVIDRYRPDWVIVVGDVNSTMAGALVCAKSGIRFAHVEAGLRSFDRTMPEEINRLVTDQLADLLFTSEPSGTENLLQEGVARERIHFVGNVMIDTLVRLLPKSRGQGLADRLGIGGDKPFVLVTLHRPRNVDDPDNLRALTAALAEASVHADVVFPVHPRTRQRLAAMGIDPSALDRCRLLEPLGYLDFLSLQTRAALVLTDSGGVQEETTYLGIPCLTVRPNTERPATLTHGTNRLVPCETAVLAEAIREGLASSTRPPARRPPLWDGRAAERIAAVLLEHADATPAERIFEQ